MDTYRARSARNVKLTQRQLDIVIGSLLGDGYLIRTTRGFALRINHGIAQRAYVDWKYNEISDLTNSPPKAYKSSYYFRTVSHQTFDELRALFYEQNRKVLPHTMASLLTPLVIAVWIMDDGAKDGNQLRLNTQSFSLHENETIKDLLMAKFGISASINRDKNLHRLRVSAASMSNVRQLVWPHIVPSMQYKLSL